MQLGSLVIAPLLKKKRKRRKRRKKKFSSSSSSSSSCNYITYKYNSLLRVLIALSVALLLMSSTRAGILRNIHVNGQLIEPENGVTLLGSHGTTKSQHYSHHKNHHHHHPRHRHLQHMPGHHRTTTMPPLSNYTDTILKHAEVDKRFVPTGPNPLHN